jgi:8-oxo-dGTP diphosphatase
MPGDLVNTATAARAVGVSPRSLARWAQEGLVVPAVVTPGGWLRWDVAELRQQLRPRAGEERVTVGDSTVPEPQPVVAAVVVSEGRMLVTWRHDKSPPAGFLSGEVEPGESAADAMVREVKEESGLRVRAVRELGRRVHPRTLRTMIYVVGEPVEETEVFVGDADELAAVRWVSLAEADAAFAPFGGMFEPVHDYLRLAIG